MVHEIALYLFCFSVFVVLQSLAINGIHESMSEGQVLNPFKKWLSKYVSEYWMNPLGNCVRCMASVYGSITFWFLVVPIFGFYFIEILIFIFDVFILVSLNYFFYKRL